ncbi:hypothetical protein ACI3L1_08240 [Deinococcus sp. SM5_A1]|uniref:hypothetical protein n=1 Tax=Deinococcus sp. SM5_A1 TaxID=3379094 RepID=UPI00385E2685
MDFINFGDLTVCDVNLAVDAGSRVQQQFYVQGLCASRAVLLGDSRAFGLEYRPGIIHFQAQEFEQFKRAALQAYDQNPIFCHLTARRIDQAVSETTMACQRVEAWIQGNQVLAAQHLVPMLEGLTRLMAYKILHDLYPTSQLQLRLAEFLNDAQLAQQLFLPLAFTETWPHYTQVNLGLIDLAIDWLESGHLLGASSFIHTCAYAFDFYIDENPLETLDGLTSHVRELAVRHGNDPQELRKIRQSIFDGHAAERQRSQAAWERLYCTPHGSPEDTLALFSALRLHQALGRVEEERHLLQMRVQRNVRDLLDAHGLPRQTTSLDVLMCAEV